MNLTGQTAFMAYASKVGSVRDFQLLTEQAQGWWKHVEIAVAKHVLRQLKAKLKDSHEEH